MRVNGSFLTLGVLYFKHFGGLEFPCNGRERTREVAAHCAQDCNGGNRHQSGNQSVLNRSSGSFVPQEAYEFLEHAFTFCQYQRADDALRQVPKGLSHATTRAGWL